MALTVKTLHTRTMPGGGGKFIVADITSDDSFAAGGESLPPSTFGLTRYLTVMVNSWVKTADNSLACPSAFDLPNNKILAFIGDNNNSDGPLIEASTVDLSTYTSRITIFGR